MDYRLTGICVYCGAQAETRDHVPSKVLLDEPYPPTFPIVGACESCNVSFSLDEQYLACLIECVICGTVETTGLQRPNVKRILSGNPSLQRRIEYSRRKDEADSLFWEAEIDRLRKVVSKLARGHAAYELYPKIEEPLQVTFAPLLTLSEVERNAFENVASGRLALWPEIGSRAFLRACGETPDRLERSRDWVVVQPGRYRYSAVEMDGVFVKIVLSEYLACMVFWGDP
jgi:hypothetical protein